MKFLFARRAVRDTAALLLLCLVVFLVHGLYGLRFGFWLDDYNHLELCRINGYPGLAVGNAFDWNQRIVHVWWAKKQAGWAYFRPLLVAIRTWELNQFGLNAVPYHIIYLVMYMASVLLFYGAIRRWGGRIGFALLAALIFTLHPSNSMPGAWLACDGPVLVAIWTFLALWLLKASMEANHRRVLPLAGIFICYALAMVSRESGVMLGPVLLVADWLASRPAVGIWRSLRGATADSPRLVARLKNLASDRQRFLYTTLAAEGVVFLLIRHHYLRHQLSPTSPYFTPPTSPGFVSWIFYKALCDFLGLALTTPFFPVVNVGWMQERPLTTLGMALAAVTILIAFLYPLRRYRVTWGIAACMAIFAAPTLMIMSAAYNYFLVSSGLAILLVMWAREMWALRWRLLSPTVIVAVLSVYAWMQWQYMWSLSASRAAEQVVVNSVMATQPALYPPGTKVFLINLPMVTVEAGSAVRLISGRLDLDFCPLTLATNFYQSNAPVSVVQEDEKTLLVQIGGPGWFSGKFGEKLQLGWYGAVLRDFREGPVQIAPVAGKLPFRVEVVKADTTGVKAFRFIFEKPLADPGYRFFVGTNSNCAQPLLFSADGGKLAADPERPWLRSSMRLLHLMQVAIDGETNWYLSWR